MIVSIVLIVPSKILGILHLSPVRFSTSSLVCEIESVDSTLVIVKLGGAIVLIQFQSVQHYQVVFSEQPAGGVQKT